MGEDAASSSSVMKSTYAIWICPKEGTEVETLLRNEMLTLAERNGAQPFTPHVTLAKDLKFTEAEIVSKAQELVKSIQKDILVTFKNLKAARDHLQTLVDLNPAGHAALKEGARIFGQEYTSPLHLSICFWPKKPDVASRRREGQDSYDRLLSPRGSLSTHPDNARGFPFTTLQIWETPVGVTHDITLRTWRMVQSFDIPTKPQRLVTKILSGLSEAATPAVAETSEPKTAQNAADKPQVDDPEATSSNETASRGIFEGYPPTDGIPKLPEDPVVLAALVAAVCGVIYVILRASR